MSGFGKWMVGYAGTWVMLAGVANVKQTAGFAAVLAWTIAGGAAIILLPDALKKFKVSGDILGKSQAASGQSGFSRNANAGQGGGGGGGGSW